MLQNNGHIHEPKGWNKLGFDQHAQGRMGQTTALPCRHTWSSSPWPPGAPADPPCQSRLCVSSGKHLDRQQEQSICLADSAPLQKQTACPTGEKGRQPGLWWRLTSSYCMDPPNTRISFCSLNAKESLR